MVASWDWLLCWSGHTPRFEASALTPMCYYTYLETFRFLSGLKSDSSKICHCGKMALASVQEIASVSSV